MEIIGIFLVLFIAYAVLNGFKTRCPVCGKHSLHPKDKTALNEQAETFEHLKKLNLGESLNNRSKPSFSNDIFNCKKCNHQFNRNESIIWLTYANKHSGNESIAEYKKIRFSAPSFSNPDIDI